MNNTQFYKRALEAQNKSYASSEANYIDNLHEIFFEQIFESIEFLSDQVRMARAYPQFLPQILKIWERKMHFRIVGPNTCYLAVMDIEDYIFFMHHMINRFTEMHVHEDAFGSFPELFHYITHLCDINITRLPGVQSLVLDGNPNAVVNEDIRDLTVMLPNLKHLTCSVNISGVHIRSFRKLEELVFRSMYHSIPLDSRFIQEVCVSMENLRILNITDSFDSCVRLYNIKLPQLEVLRMNLSTAEHIVSEILQLPKLKKLGIRFDDSRQLNADQETIFQQIIVAKSDQISRIGLNNEVVQLPSRWHKSLILELPKLRALVCENWYHDDFFLDREDLPCNQMEVLAFSGWEIVREFQMLELIADCPKLKHLSLNAYHSNFGKLNKLVSIRTLERNPSPLEVFSDTMWSHLTPDEFRFWCDHRYVQVNCDGTAYEYQEDGFEFEFDLS